MSNSSDRQVSRQNQSRSRTATWTSSSASTKASWSFSGTFSMSASASTSTSSSKKPTQKTATRSYNVPDNAGGSGPAPKRTHSQNGPTVDAPFNFVTSDASSFTVEECSDDEPEEPQLIAIPQLKPLSTSPFQTGYPSSLSNHGISKATWASFLDTISAFLEATVSQQAINHAMDIATQVGKRPKKLAANFASRAASIGQEIGNSAKAGNVFGVATGLIKGTVSIPLNLVMSTTTAVLGLPITTAIAASKTPPTPRQRATAYLAVANEQWLVPRGLFAGILDTNEVGNLLGVAVSSLPVVEEEDENGVKTEETQYSALTERVEELETWGNSPTQIGVESLWLVVTQVQS